MHIAYIETILQNNIFKNYVSIIKFMNLILNVNV